MLNCCCGPAGQDAVVIAAVEEPEAPEPEPVKQPPKEEPVQAKEEPAPAAPPKEEPKQEPAPEPVQAAKENAPPAQAPGVALEFDAGGSMQTVIAVRKPLGLIFDRSKVASIRPGSHGEELGVKPGWTMKKVGGEDISNANDKQFLDAVKRRTAELPNDKCVEIVFDRNGQDVPILATRRPFGAIFEESVPLTVKTVKEGSHAEKLRVETGWIVKSIAGTSVSGMSFADAWGLFQKSVVSLPQE